MGRPFLIDPAGGALLGGVDLAELLG
ncbi:MAG: hypothetical protein RJA94_2477, partial [Pseudomonadota bacterium]